MLLKNYCLLFVYSISTACIIYRAFYSWPHEGNKESLFLLILFPALLYQLVFIFYNYHFQKQPSRPLLLRFITFFLGLVLAGNLVSYTTKAAMSQFETVYQQMPKQIDLAKTNPCSIDFWQLDTIVNYNQTVNQFIGRDGIPIGKLWYRDSLFIIELKGGSYDFEGSTIFYDSRIKQWSKFHNDEHEKRSLFYKIISNLKVCSF